MRKINLIHRAKRKQTQKKINGLNNMVWVITKLQNDREYFVAKVDEDGTAVYWKDNIKKAMTFHTEKGCEHFQNTFLSGRTDIEVKMLRDYMI